MLLRGVPESVTLAPTLARAAAAKSATQAPRRHGAIFIYELHLGTPGCKADYLLDFLRHNESDYLYFVGDIIRGWVLNSRFYWRQTHNEVIQEVLRRARKGNHVVYVPSNHDEVGR